MKFSLKRRIAIVISTVFSLLFGISSVLIYFSFATFRRKEFEDRLEEKALTTSKLLLEVQEVDAEILKVIDRNSINQIYNEKTIVFNAKYELIYSSIDDHSIQWNINDLKYLKKNGRFFRTNNETDLFGVYYDYQKEDYYILVSAEDKYGYNKLNFLLYSLLFTFIGGTIAVWLLTRFLVKKLLLPLDTFERKIRAIQLDKNTYETIEVKGDEEIQLLSGSFNAMMLRIAESFEQQRTFTANASHELRTPLSRISLQLENLILHGDHPEATRKYLNNILEDVNQLSDILNSLLVLNKAGSGSFSNQKTERLDEMIFNSEIRLRKQIPDFNIRFTIDDEIQEEQSLEVACNATLLETALLNLMKNAINYSPDHHVDIYLNMSIDGKLELKLRNKGARVSAEEKSKWLQPFYRGENSRQISGSGLGLSIVKRILDYHRIALAYDYTEDNEHEFKLTFPQIHPHQTLKPLN